MDIQLILENLLSKTNKAALSPCGMPITVLLLPVGQGSESRTPHDYQRWRGGVRQQEVSAGRSFVL